MILYKLYSIWLFALEVLNLFKIVTPEKNLMDFKYHLSKIYKLLLDIN